MGKNVRGNLVRFFKNNNSFLRKFFLTLIFFVGLGYFATYVLAAVSITTATGGTNISADKAANASSPVYTTLGNIIITENANNDISANGTFTVQPPTGWNFNTTGVTTSTTGGLGVAVTSQTATLLTLTISGRNNGSIQSFTIIGLQVRATNGASLPSSGNITRAGGTATVAGITNGVTSLGALSQTFGVKNRLAFTTQPSVAATRSVDFATKPIIAVQDQFGSTVTTDNSSTVTLTVVLSTQVCGGTAGSGILSSTPSSGVAVTGGLMTYTAMQYSAAESIKVCAASLGIISALSNTIAVSNPVPTTTSITPSSKTAGDAQFTLTVNGTNFVSDSVVKFDGSNRTTTYVGSTQLTATIPASDLTTAGTFSITVFNPTPGGGTSNAQTFTVTSAADNQAPVVTAFIIPSSSDSLTVSVTTFTATDNVGVVGYIITESSSAPLIGDSGWVLTAPANYTFATQGSKTLYAWAKDAAGNVSLGVSDTVAVSLPSSGASSAGTGTDNASAPTIVRFAGQAFPGAKVFVIDKDARSEKTVSQESVAQEDGMFDVSFIGVLQGQHGFGLSVKDKDNRVTQTKFFNVNTASSELTIKNIIIPPTIGFVSYSVRRGNNLVIMGYAPIGHLVKFELGGKIIGEVKAGGTGLYKMEINTGPLEFGTYSVRAKQADESNQESDFSQSLNFVVSRLSTEAIKVDFNNDGKVNIQDWSIFLFRWSSADAAIKKGIDLNNDGAVNITDFSIFIRNVRK